MQQKYNATKLCLFSPHEETCIYYHLNLPSSYILHPVQPVFLASQFSLPLSLFFPRSSASCSLTTRAHNRSVWSFNHRVEGTGAWARRNCVGEGWFPRRGWRRNERFLVVGGGGRRKGTFKQLSSRSSRKLGNASFPTNICHLTPNHRLRIDHATSVRFASPPSPPRRACSPRTNTRAC